MAYQTKRRDPLFDSETQAILERRGRELAGLCFCGLGVGTALLLATYSPSDPSWLAATDSPVQNALGTFGASVASPLIVIVGVAAWVIAAAFFAWGIRLVLHQGGEGWPRMIFAPIAVALVSVFAATFPPGSGWGHSFGLGGLFGDTMLGALLGLLPLGGGVSMQLVSLGTGLAALVMAGYVLGIRLSEVRATAAVVLRALKAGGWLFLRVVAGSLARAVRPRGWPDAVEPEIAEDLEEGAADEPGNAGRSGFLARFRRTAPEPPARRAPASPVVRAEPVVRGPRAQELPEPELIRPQPSSVPTFTPRQAEVVPPAPRPKPSRKAQAEAQPNLPLEDRGEGYDAPPLGLLTDPATITRRRPSNEALEENARMLEAVLDDYGVKGEIVSVRPGPVVTMYELEPAPGLKASRVIGLADDIARSMSALSARVSTVPGRSVIGIELPNADRERVVLREILAARDYGDGTHRLPLALGKDISGEPVVANLSRMPHLLIAGTTGSGKSVAINTMILSLLYKLSPDECRLIMIDPKMLELSVYDGIPHLLSPVVTDPKKAVVALKWVVAEMEDRYRKMSKMGVRNIDGYNGRVAETLAKGEMFSRTVQTGFDDETGDPVFETEEFAPESMPYIVVIVDEMADLMMVAGKEIEACIQRLAQMARASGIHLIMATQRPSVDVITGTIKANFPTRISFQVTSKIDSRTILGEQGAEQLLGMGDMLYMAGGSKITRVHGPFCSDEEVEDVVRHLKSLGPPDYVGGVQDGPDEDHSADIDAVLGLGGNTDGEDALYDQAVAIVLQDRKCSTSYIQRKLAIGYNKAARLVEQMEEQGLVTSANHVGKREILVPEQG